MNAELSNEYAAQFYGFSPVSFADNVHNAICDSWLAAVQLLSESPALAPLRANKEFQRTLRKQLFKKGILTKTIDELSEYCLRYIFRIPSCVTLPEHRVHLTLPEDYNEDAVKKEIHTEEKRMKKNRSQLAMLDNEIEKVTKYMEILEELLRSVGIDVDDAIEGESMTFEDITDNGTSVPDQSLTA